MLCHLLLQAHLVCLDRRSRPQNLLRSPHVTLRCRMTRLNRSCYRRFGLRYHCSLGGEEKTVWLRGLVLQPWMWQALCEDPRTLQISSS